MWHLSLDYAIILEADARSRKTCLFAGDSTVLSQSEWAWAWSSNGLHQRIVESRVMLGIRALWMKRLEIPLSLVLALLFRDCCSDEHHFGIAPIPIFCCMASPNHSLRNVMILS